jgi:hypothetical protein
LTVTSAREAVANGIKASRITLLVYVAGRSRKSLELPTDDPGKAVVFFD